MRAGTLRERISILKRVTTTDSHGGRAVTWVDLITGTANLTRLPANVAPRAAGAEGLQAGRVVASANYTIKMRYRADITPLMRVQWTPFRATSALTLEISNMNPSTDGRKSTEFDCTEV